MKNKALLRTIFILLATAFFVTAVLPWEIFSVGGYSDEKYYYYANIDGAVDVPTLFKQDSGFANDRSFPLVIQSGIEYVPLEMFIGLSGISIEYSENNNSFYIQNKKLNRYISFDLTTGYAISESSGAMLLETKQFYGTIYVPVKITAATVGIYYESSQDRVQKLYCVRLYDDTSKKTLDGLIDEYVSRFVGYEPSTGKDNAADGSQSGSDGQGGKPNTQPGVGNGEALPPDGIPPEQQEAERKDEIIENEKEEERAELVIDRRNIFFAFTSSPNESTAEILDMLKESGTKAVFFCNADGMLAYPELVRRIIVEGHSIGICPGNEIFPARKLEEMSENETKAEKEDNTTVVQDDIGKILEDIERSKEVLLRLTKRTSRLYYLPNAMKSITDIGKIYSSKGLYAVTPEIESGDCTDATRVRIAADITDYLWNMGDGEQNAVIMFNSTEKSALSAQRVIEFAAERPQVRVKRLAEGTVTAAMADN